MLTLGFLYELPLYVTVWLNYNYTCVTYNAVKANFEFINKLGVDRWCFHDRDIAPDGKTLEVNHFLRLLLYDGFQWLAKESMIREIALLVQIDKLEIVDLPCFVCHRKLIKTWMKWWPLPRIFR